MAEPITIFRKTTGLNTKIDPVDLDYSEGISELAIAADIEISDKGRLSRRKGYTRVNTNSCHSLFCDGGTCICVSGTDLCIIGSDYKLTSVATVTENAKLSACQINDSIYWLNGHEKGIIIDGVNSDWVTGDYVGPETKKTFIDPPIGTIVESFNGRLYVVQGNTLWFSEPFNYGSFDPVRGFIFFDSSIRMVRATIDGLYISTAHEIIFLSGTNPNEFQLVQLTDYPATSGSDAKLFGDFIRLQDGTETITKTGSKAAIWLSHRGICYGGAGGNFTNLTEEKLFDLPNGLSGSGIVYNGKYLGLIDP